MSEGPVIPVAYAQTLGYCKPKVCAQSHRQLQWSSTDLRVWWGESSSRRNTGTAT